MILHELRVTLELTPLQPSISNSFKLLFEIYFREGEHNFCASWIIYLYIEISFSRPGKELREKRYRFAEKQQGKTLLFVAFLSSVLIFSIIINTGNTLSLTHTLCTHMSFSVFDVRNQEIGFYRHYSSIELGVYWKLSIFWIT